MRFYLESTEALPHHVKLIVCLVVSLLLGVLDYATGDFSLMMFYLLPIAAASWFTGVKGGLAVAIVCALELLGTDYLLRRSYLGIWNIRTWNALVEAFSLVLTGYLISRVRQDVDRINSRSAELEAANRELDAFNYSVAHDLRTPLNLIYGYVQLIQEACGSELTKSCSVFLGHISEGSLRMSRTIDALLKFSRMGRTEPEIDLIDLADVARGIAEDLDYTEPERRVTWCISQNIPTFGDRDLLRIVLENLLGNAWKYTRTNEEAVIEVGVKGEEKPVFYVKDNGIGFHPEDADRLFLPFQRLNTAESFQGIGIGLATVQKIIHGHSGRIWAEGEPGKGAVFFFTLWESGIPNGRFRT